MELMVVILIITILTAMIIPELRGTLEEALLRSSARQLAGACDLAYSRAVAAGQLHRLQIDPATGRFSVERPVGRDVQTGRSTRADIPGAKGVIDRRITVKLSHPTEGTKALNSTWDRAPAERTEGINFYADGTAQASEIVLQDRAGFRLSLHINPVTSRIKLKELAR
jgi:Tfp pilus assembly protein FimT